MHIHSIKMGNFKSYRNVGSQFELVFSPEVNVLVGSNGSGKSNFFIALQFILGHGDYKTLTKQLKRSLLHSGSGQNPALTAFVELTLDNRGGRMSLDTEDTFVKICRTVGMKSDEYRVNDLSTPASEVAAMLEAAGLSASNPHYIVKQGQIMRFGAMQDDARFTLLKEVAGTVVYETRRARSLETLLTADHNLEIIQKNINNLDERLLKLGEEREEFKKFRGIENHHKCMMYALYKKTADGASEELRALQEGLEDTDHKANEAVERLYAENQILKELERDAAAASVALQQAKRERDVVLQERNGWEKSLARAQVTMNHEVAKKTESAGQMQRAEDALVSVRKEIERVTAAYNKKNTTLSDEEARLAHETQNLAALESRTAFLITKRGRHNQFSTQADRDKWLNEQIRKQESDSARYKADYDGLVKERDVTIPARIEKLKQTMDNKRSSLHDAGKQNDTRRAQIEQLTKNRDALAEKRRHIFRDQAGLQQGLDEITEKEAALQQKMGRAMPRDILEGRRSVEKAIQLEGITGVYGPVVSLFETNKELFTCCDVMAANSLFHIVVDTNQTASKILHTINKHKLPGRPSFYPLNRLQGKAKQLPTKEEECFPLYDKLSFDPLFASVMADLFGRVLVCSNLAIASARSRDHNCDCVLTSGDKVDSRGGIAGGFIGDKISRMGAWFDLKEIKQRTQALKERQATTANEAAEIDQKMLEARRALQEQEEQAVNFSRNRERESYDVRAFEADKRQLQQLLKQKDTAIIRQGREIEDMAKTIKAYTEELKTTMATKLTESEASELKQGQQELDEKKKAHSIEVAKFETLQGETRQLANQLEMNLTKRETELQTRVSSLGNMQEDKVLDQRHAHDVELIKKRLDSLKTDLESAESKIDSHTKERRDKLSGSEASREKLKKLQTDAGKERFGLDKHKRERAGLLEKHDGAVDQIRKLGALPQDAEDYEQKVSAMTTGEVQGEIADAKQKLKALSHVNRKAYDQFTQLSNSRERLHKDLSERLKEKDLLQGLIEDLDEKKDGAVLRTFKQVKVFFAQTFKELVEHPNASAELVLHKKENAQGGKRVDEFVGVGVKINFGMGEVTDISPLSGGQKSVVALSLIFAIQQCDPAPFYVFDEIDAALDSQFRTAVAKKIQSASKDAQFLMVSFKEEMLSISKRNFAIDFKNKTSILRPCSDEDARLVLHEAARSATKRKRDDEQADIPTQPL